MNDIRGISVWQPWASLWALQIKLFETRSWATNYRGQIAIHAAAKSIKSVLRECFPCGDWEFHPSHFAKSHFLGVLKAYGINIYDIPLGAIIATAELVGCHKMVRHGGRGMSYYGSGWLETDEGIYEPDEIELLFGDWTPGRFAWEVANVKLLDKPIPYKGAQGLWRIPNAEEILKGVL